VSKANGLEGSVPIKFYSEFILQVRGQAAPLRTNGKVKPFEKAMQNYTLRQLEFTLKPNDVFIKKALVFTPRLFLKIIK